MWSKKKFKTKTIAGVHQTLEHLNVSGEHLKQFVAAVMQFPFFCFSSYFFFTESQCHWSPGPPYLYPAEEDLVPDAVAADDPGTDFGSFSLGCKVEQPPLEWSVGLAEDLQKRHSGLQSVWVYLTAGV